MITRFTLVRHGETAWNVSGRWQGHAPIPLNEIGRYQAELLAAHLAGNGVRYARVVTSDSLRARETADLLGRALSVPVDPDPRLREYDLGEWQGLTLDEVRTWDATRYDAVERDPWNIRRPGGESGAEVAARAVACLEAHAEADAHVIVVSHGGTIRNLLIQLGVVRPDRLVVGNTSCSVVLRTPAGDGASEWSLERFNAQDHLGDAQARIEVEP